MRCFPPHFVLFITIIFFSFSFLQKSDTTQGQVLELLDLAYQMLQEPLPEPLPSFDALREFWEHHPADCPCPRGNLLPAPFREFERRTPSQQHAMLQALQDAIRANNNEAYYNYAQVCFERPGRTEGRQEGGGDWKSISRFS